MAHSIMTKGILKVRIYTISIMAQQSIFVVTITTYHNEADHNDIRYNDVQSYDNSHNNTAY